SVRGHSKPSGTSGRPPACVRPAGDCASYVSCTDGARSLTRPAMTSGSTPSSAPRVRSASATVSRITFGMTVPSISPRRLLRQPAPRDPVQVARGVGQFQRLDGLLTLALRQTRLVQQPARHRRAGAFGILLEELLPQLLRLGPRLARLGVVLV